MGFLFFIMFLFVCIVVSVLVGHNDRDNKRVAEMESFKNRMDNKYGILTAFAGDYFHQYYIYDSSKIIIIDHEEIPFNKILASNLVVDKVISHTYSIQRDHHQRGIVNNQSTYAVCVQINDFENPTRMYKCGENIDYANKLNSVLNMIVNQY